MSERITEADLRRLARIAEKTRPTIAGIGLRQIVAELRRLRELIRTADVFGDKYGVGTPNYCYRCGYSHDPRDPDAWAHCPVKELEAEAEAIREELGQFIPAPKPAPRR